MRHVELISAYFTNMVVWPTLPDTGRFTGGGTALG